MRRVLMVSPHFPPDTSAGTHRVRLLAPHLPRYGWEPTVVSVDPQFYEGRLDHELAAMVPSELPVMRCRALSARTTRKMGLGDLGLRAYFGLRETCRRLLREEQFDALFITIFPSYPAMLGPALKREFRIPFVLDYQDPWVGSWGQTVGGGPNGRPDLKSRITRRLATWLEPRAVRAADAITAVSEGTYDAIHDRNPAIRNTPCVAIPLGGEPRDFEYLRRHPRHNPHFDPHDGNVHVCYVGTLLPMGFETLRAVLKAVRLLKEWNSELADRLRLHFFGTSNQTHADAPHRVLPAAEQIGVADLVTEVPPRLDYLDAQTVQTQATAILMMGSSERHYTASKLYPGLLAKRPILAVYHEASSVVEILREAVQPPTARLVSYGDTVRAEDRVEELYFALTELMQSPVYRECDVDMSRLAPFSAESLAGRLAATFDRVAESASRCSNRTMSTSPQEACPHA